MLSAQDTDKTFNLLLLRHGKSDWRVDVSDDKRPLKPRGEKAARRIGVWMSQYQVPDYILSSPALRAWHTCKIACAAMGIPEQRIQCDNRAYHAAAQTIISLLRSVPVTHRCVLFVGHNPGMEQALLQLLPAPPPGHSDGKVLPTGTLAHLEFQQPWPGIDNGSAQLKGIVRGKELAAG